MQHELQQPARDTICVVLKGYPRLSETFIAQELLELERAGFSLHLVSLRHPTDKKTHPIHDEITAPITYLPEYLYQEPLRVLRGLVSSITKPGFWSAFGQFLRDFRRDFTTNRGRRFGQALVLANEMPEGMKIVYAHFLHTPASVANYARIITGLPWSCSAHAKDIWTSPDWEKTEKLASMRFLATCTRSGADHLASLADRDDTVNLIYHGLDLDRFPEFERPLSENDGSAEDKTVRLVTVGRAVAKKGLDTLLDALARLPGDLHWHWTHIGGGELSDDLKSQAKKLGLSERITWKGSQPQTTVLETYRSSDLFVLPCRITADGDRDGLPNVLVEAASQKMACISTPISGIVELFEDGVNSMLVPPNEADALAHAIDQLARDPELRLRYGMQAEQKVRSDFDHLTTIRRLIALFEENGIRGTLSGPSS